MRVVIAGGGTAGHVNPALALARALEGDEVLFLGTETGAEARLVPAAGFDLEVIDVKGWDRSRPASIPATVLRAAGAAFSSRRFLGRVQPNVVVGMGGYVSLPVCIAARTRRIPIVLHEQNVVLGLANKVCKRWARSVAVSFRESLSAAGPRAIFTGNPVLESIANYSRDALRSGALERFELDPQRKTLLLFGGSQGARRINEAARGFRTIWGRREDLQILHVTGKQAPAAEEHVGPLIYRAVEFVDRMTEAYAAADLAVARGGATTVAELGVVGLPSIIVPYPHHRDRQQELHGRILESGGAAVVILDADATPEALAGTAESLLTNDTKLHAMRDAALSFGRPHAAQELARVVKRVAA